MDLEQQVTNILGELDASEWDDFETVVHTVVGLIQAREAKLLKEIEDAWTIKGSHPDYHDEQMRYLETHWPSLYLAIKRTLKAKQAALKEKKV